MKNKVQLITYVDRLGGNDFQDLRRLLTGSLKGVFGGLHVLPFFYPIDGADAGFDPVDHLKVDPRLGRWEDVAKLSEELELVVDVIVNHVSSDSPQYLDYYENGDASDYAGLFLTFDDVFPDGATERELMSIYRPRPGLPFTVKELANGQKKLFWTTFTSRQLDINVFHPNGQQYLEQVLDQIQEAKVKMVRLDAVGYAVKKAGSNCFMLPETTDYILELSNSIKSRGMEVLLEVHAHYQQQIDIAKQVDYVYDFALPPLILQAIYSKNPQHLKKWLDISPRNAISVLDTHDGIGVIDVGPDETRNKPGLLSKEEMATLVNNIHEHSKGTSKQATGALASNVDIYQVNTTFFDALGQNEAHYLLARAIQFFAPGIPQVYYVGLLGGTNDMELLQQTNVGRNINRSYYNEQDVLKALDKPMVRKLLKLIAFRNEHAAFDGDFLMINTGNNTWSFRREDNRGKQAILTVDFTALSFSIQYSDDLDNMVLLDLKNA